MRLRNVKNAKEKLLNSKYFIENPEMHKGNWESVFANSHEIHLEIGTGKGDFLIAMAKAHPEINFIGIEKYESVLVRAIEKVSLEDLPNIRFLCFDAKKLPTVFSPELSKIYLNFSDPWPKTRHAKRRLTHMDFLKIYEDLFRSEKVIVQKTDNIKLFAFSLEQLSQFGYILERVNLDLTNEEIFNIKTEYESKFESLGFKINYVEARKK